MTEPALRRRTTARRSWLVTLAAVLVLALYAGIHLPAFEDARGLVGHDYAAMLPWLLRNTAWYDLHGLFAQPWFTPAICGGVPEFSNPQSFYWSLPQVLAFWFESWTAVQLSFVIFAGLQFVGMWLLCRDVFVCSRAGRWIASVVFLFNAFYAERMLVGHLTFHGFALIPLFLWLLFRPAGDRAWRDSLRWSLGLGLISAYWIFSGFVQGLLPVLWLVIVLLLLRHAAVRELRWWLRALFGAGLGVLLTAPKLVAMWHFMVLFPRDQYTLPGFSGIGALYVAAVRSLFGFWGERLVNKGFLENSLFVVRSHELTFSVTPLPVLLGVAVLWARARSIKLSALYAFSLASWLRGLALALALMVPMLINLYSPGWNAVLKQIPVIKSSSLLMRWWLIYVVLLAVWSGQLFSALEQRWRQPWLLWLSLLFVIGFQTLRVQVSEHGYGFALQALRASDQAYRRERRLVPIQRLADHDEQGVLIPGSKRNLMFTEGISTLRCNAPEFGYRTERLPRSGLREGAALEDLGDGTLNMRDPRCLLFPYENACRADARFKVADRQIAEDFVHYRVIPFAAPPSMRWASWLQAIGVALALGMLSIPWALSRRKRRF